MSCLFFIPLLVTFQQLKNVQSLTQNFTCSCNKIVRFSILVYDSNKKLTLNVKLSFPPANTETPSQENISTSSFDFILLLIECRNSKIFVFY